MDPDVEISAPFHQKPSRFKKQKQPGFTKSGNSTLQLDNSKMGSASLQIKTDNVDRFSGTKAAFNNKKSGESQHFALDLNSLPGDKSSKFQRFKKVFHLNVKKFACFGSQKQGLADNPDAMKLPHLGQIGSAKHGAASSSSFHSNLVGHDGSLHPPEHTQGKTSLVKSARVGHSGASVVPPGLTEITDEPENQTLMKLRSFKQFDIVDDTSDHHYVKNNSSMKQNPTSWAKKIQEEWMILEKHLPDAIFVRVFESRMDLLRAVIIGAEGTPYQDGLFFFDVFFPSDYPNVPPHVHYHAGGLRLNPNLYASGRVCLSLLNTWYGQNNEKWTPGVSTMLQVLVSIQGLILNVKPYFNEPGYAHLSGIQKDEAQSLKYNENTFILSVRTMMYTMKNPPKNFKELVVGHFYSRAHDILAACKAYMEGVQVGCFVKGGVQDVDKGDEKNSDKFKADLPGYVKLLVQDFKNFGVKDCQKFML